MRKNFSQKEEKEAKAMELMLDSAKLKALEAGLYSYPVAGVTTNPSILKAEGEVPLWEHLRQVKALCGPRRSLHVQVVSNTTKGILTEAERIRARLGSDVYIKIPVSPAGLPAIKTLAQRGARVTATAVYTSLQGMLAAIAGAGYIAVYFNRIEKMGEDPDRAIREIAAFLAAGDSDAKILAASFHRQDQLVRAYAAGAQSATVSPALLDEALRAPCIEKAVADFAADFELVHGSGSDMTAI